MNMRMGFRVLGLVFAAVLVCGVPVVGWAYSHQGVVDAMDALRQGRSGDGKEPKLDVNRYFEVLGHLRLDDNMVLDYVLFNDGMGGGPRLYLRRKDDAPLKDYEAFEKRFGGKARSNYLDNVHADGTEESFFEFAVLAIMGDQFDLFWHSNYNDFTIVCDPEALDRLLGRGTGFGGPIPDEVRTAARSVNCRPSVALEGDVARVGLTGFTKWGGVERLTFSITRGFPHVLQDTKRQTLVSYDCGICF